MAGVVVGGNLVPSQAWWEPYRWCVWVAGRGAGGRLRLAAGCWLLSWYSALGEEGSSHVHLMQGPWAVWLSFPQFSFFMACTRLGTYTDRGPRADKTWMDTRRAGPAAATVTGARGTRRESPRGMAGPRDSHSRPRRAERGSHRVGGLADARITPACLGTLQGPTTYGTSLERCRDLVPSGLCVRAWPHSGDPRRDLGHGGPTRAGKLMEKCRGSLRLCPGA